MTTLTYPDVQVVAVNNNGYAARLLGLEERNICISAVEVRRKITIYPVGSSHGQLECLYYAVNILRDPSYSTVKYATRQYDNRSDELVISPGAHLSISTGGPHKTIEILP